MSTLKIKTKCLGRQCWSSSDAKTPFPGAKAMLTFCVCANACFLWFFYLFFNLEETLTCLMFSVLIRYKTLPETILLLSSFLE